MQPPPDQSRNRLLASLPPGDYQQLAQRLQMVPLSAKQTLYRFKDPIDAVYFPTSGIISAMTVMHDGAEIEVATIGNEGMSGLSAFMGTAESSPYEVMVQVPGKALRLSASALKAEVAEGKPLYRLLARYYTAFTVQVSYSVACNGLHKIEQRCCRWLLMAADRIGSNSLNLRHEFIGVMLGVRRASVTETLHSLEGRGLIRTARGLVEIVDRPGMEDRSCECYRVVTDEYNRLVGIP